MPKPYPQEFRDDVVRVARNREQGVTLAQVAKDFGIHEMTLNKWMRKADIEDGTRPGATASESAALRDLRRSRARLQRSNAANRSPTGQHPGDTRGCNSSSWSP